MLTISAANVNESYPQVLALMKSEGIQRSSRNGPVLQLPEGLAVRHYDPTQRVLFDIERDANPFFHLMEAMWMLCGRSDVDFVARYAKQMNTYSDDGRTLNGAYGYRWRNYFEMDDEYTDQLDLVIRALRKNPDDRRQVISMWDPVADLTNAESKDLPCNLSAVPQIGPDGRLNLTVFNRSNDVVWGMLGANVVHFSFLLEYLALRIGVQVGWLEQVSANPHLYIERHGHLLDRTDVSPFIDELPRSTIRLLGSTEDHSWFDAALEATLSRDQADLLALGLVGASAKCNVEFLDSVVMPMMIGHALWAAGQKIEASTFVARSVKDPAWAAAAIYWMERRISGKV